MLGVHRAIDQLAQESSEAAAAAATLFPAYGLGAAGWSDRFARMLTEHRADEAADIVTPSIEDIYPPLEEALLHLTDGPPRHAWDGVRRLQALAALTRVSPAHAPGGELGDLVQRAVQPLLVKEADAAGFHALLAEHQTLVREEWDWHVARLVETAGLRSTYAVRSGPSCTGDIIGVVIEGDREPVTVLTTSFKHPTLTVADLDHLLDPSRWPDCPGFWCTMTEELPPPDTGIRRFIEVVASDCDGTWRITTRLDFARRDWADGSASLEYWLSSDQSMPADGMVVIDEGSIVVAPLDDSGGPGVHVTSTKRIRFIEPMDGAQLAATSCALGWSDAGEKFAFGCAEPEPKPEPEPEPI